MTAPAGTVINGGTFTVPPALGFMHDGLSQSFQDAIGRHAGQAAASRAAFNGLSSVDRNRVLLFLSSL